MKLEPAAREVNRQTCPEEPRARAMVCAVGGGRTPPALLAALAALAFLSGLILGTAGAPAERAAAASTTLGVDVDTADNTAGHVADVQNCKEVAVGDQFTVDIFADDIDGLSAWELRFAFDHNVVRIVNHNYNMFLLSTAPSGAILPALFDRESDDRYFLAAAEVSGTPDTGSGVLARVTLQAIAPGRSPAEVVVDPGYLAPYLTKAGGAGLFTGAVAEGEISVGQPCGDTTPTVAPGSTTGPGGGTPGPSGAPGSSATPGPGTTIAIDDPGKTPAAPGAAAGDDPNSTPTPPGTVRQPSGSAPQNGDHAPGSQSGPQDSSGFPWLLAGSIAGAVLAAGVAGTFTFVIRYKT